VEEAQLDELGIALTERALTRRDEGEEAEEPEES
jgi:hypothetical protein